MARHSQLMKDFCSLLPMVDAVSFDVFDTLFVRLLEDPKALFSLMGQQLGEPNFLEQRIEAQTLGFEAMHRDGRGEITLEDIYNNLPHPRYDADTLSAQEQQLEGAVARLNPEVAALFTEARRAGKTVVLTSDMYLPQSFFIELVRLHGHGLEPDHYLVSSACNCTKRDDGALFDVLKQRLGLDGARILHVGDNPLGDIRRAQEKGLRTLHYQPPKAIHAPIAIEHVSRQFCAGLIRYRAYRSDINRWASLGWEYGGPLLHGFLDWIQEQAVLDQVDRILFISRDGFLLQQTHQNYPHSDVPGLYMRGSRVAFTLAALDERNFIENAPFLLSGSDNITLQDLFDRIAVELPDTAVLEDLGLHPSTRLHDGTRPLISQFLITMRHRILQAARQTRRGLHQHLLELGLKDGMRVAFVDVGWSGTTQHAFERAISGLLSIEVEGYYLGLSEPSTAIKRRTGMSVKALTESILLDKTQQAELYENRAVAELLFSAPHPTTIGYSTHQNALRFLEDIERGVDYDLSAIVDAINTGIIEYIQNAEQAIRPLRVPVERTLPMSNLLKLVAHPTPEQATIIGELYNWDAWASTEHYRIYFAGRPPTNAHIYYKPDLWPAGWRVAQRSSATTGSTSINVQTLQNAHDR